MSGEHPSLWEPPGPRSSGNELVSCSPRTETALFRSSASLGTVVVPLCSLLPLGRPHRGPPAPIVKGGRYRAQASGQDSVTSCCFGAGPSPLIPDPMLSSPNKTEKGILNTWSHPDPPKINIPVFQKADRNCAVRGGKPRACWTPGLVGTFLFVRGRKAAPVAMAT
ncbi:unnamed protein product [Rangifer tarandus platyrhynchus]|uniref:Uncharacterized protein n=2 Tax=Rangifer tarandus platyrhynchus TaxID=3082113 RepID=A0ABN8Z3A4_RANTA|nr:unnamed protein product [Rangifer tarandus platyrhynchus]